MRTIRVAAMPPRKVIFRNRGYELWIEPNNLLGSIMAEEDEQEDFSWIRDSATLDEELSPYLEDVPSDVRILYVYTNENYSIGKVRKEVLDISNGVLSKEELSKAIAANRTHDGLRYRFACAFQYITNCSASQVIACGEEEGRPLDAQLQEMSVLEDLHMPRCTRMLQKLNGIYVVFQRMKSSPHKRVTKKVRFEPQAGRKTRRL